MAEERPFITLVSSDDHRFILPRSAANGSTFLKDTLESDFGEAQTGVIKLAELRAEIVEKLAEYLMYKDRWTGSKEDPPDFQPRVQPDIALELLQASDFMGC